MLSSILTVAAFLAVCVPDAQAIGQDTCVTFNSTQNSSFAVVSNGQAAPIFLSEDEWPGVQIAVSSFANDIQMVTNAAPLVQNTSSSFDNTSRPILVGTLGQSSLIDSVLNNTGLDVSHLNGSWESFMAQEVENPLPGIDTAFVVIGSDKRGTIFALYDLSEQMGVSPWYWCVCFLLHG